MEEFVSDHGHHTVQLLDPVFIGPQHCSECSSSPFIRSSIDTTAKIELYYIHYQHDHHHHHHSHDAINVETVAVSTTTTTTPSQLADAAVSNSCHILLHLDSLSEMISRCPIAFQLWMLLQQHEAETLEHLLNHYQYNNGMMTSNMMMMTIESSSSSLPSSAARRCAAVTTQT
mmetsp:Transcript_18220/g.51905  ORF Transcript_18220/g.51905 Transcript_18220/m.51905 type:complete len:173 (+) Transcript_18220:924-1442(+)